MSNAIGRRLFVSFSSPRDKIGPLDRALERVAIEHIRWGPDTENWAIVTARYYKEAADVVREFSLYPDRFPGIWKLEPARPVPSRYDDADAYARRRHHDREYDRDNVNDDADNSDMHVALETLPRIMIPNDRPHTVAPVMPDVQALPPPAPASTIATYQLMVLDPAGMVIKAMRLDPTVYWQELAPRIQHIELTCTRRPADVFTAKR